ncbi:hypothetical protein BDW02DRAFT_578646 [Decorospora gaudefroyi]|uniref:Copper amine oxidase catalytic domain-containing protein n=1 Tax=Decorospora gaudefroyi TaxID=184978 RepID=A0A6A5KHY6_9PLEO|nr:hypothetical protein BDW02DRAFT_578646 [Decorospora gaudefroyi]
MDFPFSRHRTAAFNNYGFSNFGTVKGVGLIVRAIATVRNYDYMSDCTLCLDASLEVVEEFGPRIQRPTQSSFHNYIITYKADFDMVGTSNSLQFSGLIVKRCQDVPRDSTTQAISIKTLRAQRTVRKANGQSWKVELSKSPAIPRYASLCASDVQ